MEINRRTVSYFAIFVVLFFCVFAFLYWSSLLTPINGNDQGKEVVIDIPKNSNCNQISTMMYEADLVRGPDIISFYARLHGLDQRLKPGRYIFKTNQSVPELAASLISGPNHLIVFTVPEGYSVIQLTDLLVKKGLVKSDSFKAALDNKSQYTEKFVGDIPAGMGLEGYLFPDTYHVGDETKEEKMVAMMLDRFQSELIDLDYKKKVKEANLSLHQAVTIASMVEGEAAVDGERALIAGVIFNRLRLGMPLQIDATVKYALGGEKKKIYYKDLEVDSPYNTYRIRGLPPGPINSPGRASLLAVVQPVKTNYLYYVAKKDGSHAFATTLQEHNRNIAKYQ